MCQLIKMYQQACLEPSDINEHLPVLNEYALECSHITEMGTRTGVSTVALLASYPERLISYDIKSHSGIYDIIKAADSSGIGFRYVIADVLDIDIEATDLLFIDTLHTYSQLFQELNRHADKVSKYIILHDTETFAYKDEQVYSHASGKLKGYGKKGLIAAVKDFLPGSGFEIHKIYKNNNGLMILKRCGA